MKIERPQAAVPWVPSRYRYALFRLAAFVRLTRTPPEACTPADTKVLAIDRDQSTGEAYATAMLVWLTTSAFTAHLLSSRLVLAAAIVLAIPIAIVAFSAAIVLVGLTITPILHLLGLPRGPSNIATNSAVILIAIALAASYFATLAGWVGVIAWIFLTCVAANGIAAIILFAIRGRVRAEEMRCVA